MRRWAGKRKSTSSWSTYWLTSGIGRPWSRQIFRKRRSRSLLARVVPASNLSSVVLSLAAPLWPGMRHRDRAEGGVVGELVDLDLVEKPLEVTARQDRGEVEDGAGGRGHGDAVARGDLVRRQGARAMDPETRPLPAAPRHRYVRPTRRVRADAPQRTRRPVAEHRARTAREHGGHPAAVPAQDRVTDRVDPTVDAVEAPGCDAVGDRLPSESDGPQLTRRDDAVLPGGERRDPPVHGPWADFDRTVRSNSAHSSSIARHAPSMPGRDARVARGSQRFARAFATRLSRRC